MSVIAKPCFYVMLCFCLNDHRKATTVCWIPNALDDHRCLTSHSVCFFSLFLYRVLGTGDMPILVVGNKRDLQRGRVIPRHNMSDLVRKNWKCGYVECSAKFNWHVLLLFGEALRSVGCARCKHVHATIRFQRALRNERCALMWFTQWRWLRTRVALRAIGTVNLPRTTIADHNEWPHFCPVKLQY